MEQIDFNRIILILKKRPGMIIGEENINYLSLFFNGYFVAKKKNELTHEESNFNNHFDDFIHEYYDDKTTHGWASLLWYNEGSHKNAIKKFNILYEEFKKKYEN